MYSHAFTHNVTRQLARLDRNLHSEPVIRVLHSSAALGPVSSSCAQRASPAESVIGQLLHGACGYYQCWLLHTQLGCMTSMAQGAALHCSVCANWAVAGLVLQPHCACPMPNTVQQHWTPCCTQRMQGKLPHKASVIQKSGLKSQASLLPGTRLTSTVAVTAGSYYTLSQHKTWPSHTTAAVARASGQGNACLASLT